MFFIFPECRKNGLKRKKKIDKEDDKDWKPETISKEKSIKRKESFNKIQTVHEDQKDYKCESCGKSYTGIHADKTLRKHILRIHERRERGIKLGKNRKTVSQKDFESYQTFELTKPLDAYRGQARQNLKGLPKNGKLWDKMMNDPRKTHQCGKCKKKFLKDYQLKHHIIMDHNEHYLCEFCDAAFYIHEAKEFKQHLFLHSCGKMKSKQSKVARIPIIICVQCGKKTSGAGLKQHLKTQGPLHNDECAQCSRKINSFEEYQDHVKDQHYGIWKYKCGHCGEMFHTEQDCQKHIYISCYQKEVQKDYKCDSCNKLFSEERYLKRHITKVHNETKEISKKPEICHLCGASAISLQAHMKYNHSTDQELKCSYCDKTFLNRRKLNYHEQIHIQQPCPICGKMVKKPKVLYHMRQNHTSNEDKPFKCDVCGKGFISKFHRDEHVNIHTGAKPFKCKYCSTAAYASYGTLRMHERSHLGIKRKPKNS